MLLQLNDKEFYLKIDSVGTLQNVLDKIEEEMTERFVISRIIINDKELNNDWHDNIDSVFVLDEDIVKVLTKDPFDAGKETFDSSQDYLYRLIEDLEMTADKFRMEDEAVANRNFVQSIENIQLYLNTLTQSMMLMGRSMNRLVIDNLTFDEYVNVFAGKLSEMTDIQQQKDWVLLADMIQYELIPVLKKLEVIYKLI
ncbi:MAG: hypothetical protein CSB55_07300 [Candidatus Cloacimonadota bacterium]|nr:MAG: hypothetical protein CSB55_07300 [Candidatus Cloacimonadota bacterium]